MFKKLASERKRRLHRRRTGFSLIELMVASASATILVAGLGSSIYITSRAFDDADGTIAHNLNASFAAEEIHTDLQLATSFIERSSTAVEFRVPDRDGDGAKELIRYAWSGTAGDPLTKSVNGSAPESVLDGVASLNLGYSTRTLASVEAPIIFVPGITYEEFEETKLGNEAGSITLSTPAGTTANDLLIAAISVIGDSTERFKESMPGWTLAGTAEESRDVTLGVWYRIAASSELTEHTFEFQDKERAYGWMMRFSGNDTDVPIENFASNTGDSKKPEAPAVEIASDNSLVLRIGAFASDNVKTDNPDVSDHTGITMDFTDGVAGGAAFQADVETGKGEDANFALGKKASYVAATLVIRPALEAPE